MESKKVVRALIALSVLALIVSGIQTVWAVESGQGQSSARPNNNVVARRHGGGGRRHGGGRRRHGGGRRWRGGGRRWGNWGRGAGFGWGVGFGSPVYGRDCWWEWDAYSGGYVRRCYSGGSGVSVWI